VRSEDGSEYRVRTCEEYRLATRILQQEEELSTYFRELEREYEKVVSFRMRLRETSTGEVGRVAAATDSLVRETRACESDA
jgi:hypothetical protein